MNINPLIGTGLIAFASKDMIEKLLGPTCDYLGNEVKSFVEKRSKNIGSIFNKASRKIGDKINEPGEVDPRVLRNIIDEGSFCEEDLTQEYYAGLLASSRQKINEKNEDTIPFLNLIKCMSSNQIALHYFIYYPIIKELKNMKINLFQEPELHKLSVEFTILSIIELFPNLKDLGTTISNECTLGLKEKLFNILDKVK